MPVAVLLRSLLNTQLKDCRNSMLSATNRLSRGSKNGLTHARLTHVRTVVVRHESAQIVWTVHTMNLEILRIQRFVCEQSASQPVALPEDCAPARAYAACKCSLP